MSLSKSPALNSTRPKMVSAMTAFLMVSICSSFCSHPLVAQQNDRTAKTERPQLQNRSEWPGLRPSRTATTQPSPNSISSVTKSSQKSSHQSPAQHSPVSPVAPKVASPQPDIQPNQQMVDEINEIRARLGGGVARQLEGMFADEMPLVPIPQVKIDENALPKITPTQGTDAAQVEFNRQLRDLVDKSNRPSQSVLPAAPGIIPVGHRVQVPEQADQGRGADPHLPAVNTPSSVHREGTNWQGDVNLERIRRIRSAARYLDVAAAELEEVAQYAEADNLRKRAALLRETAR